MDMIVLAIAMAVVVEALIEYAKSIYKAFADGERKTAATQIAAIAVSVALCFAAGADIFAALDVGLNPAAIGTILTGIFCSRGANYVSDLVKKLQNVMSAE